MELGDGETATVVCGAPNVAAGQMIAFAKEGALLFNPRSGKPEPLRAATIRGVESRGMVCSALELGLGDDHEGILVLDPDAPLGAPLIDHLGDTVLDIEVTPNRPDCMSVLGVAREAAALTGQEATEPDLSYEELGPPIGCQVTIEIGRSAAMQPVYGQPHLGHHHRRVAPVDAGSPGQGRVSAPSTTW